MIYLALVLLLLPPFVHVSYVYTMGLKRARDENRLTLPVKLFAYPTLAFMIPFYITNDTVGRLSFKNKIINGGFDIWQRGTSLSGTSWFIDFELDAEL